jgi:hypothetical protein
VGLADLDTVDLVTGPPGGDQGLWIVAADWPVEREALDYVQLLVKLAAVRAHAERLDGAGHRSTVLMHNAGEPPMSVLEFVRERDVAAMIGGPGGPRPASGRRARYPNLHDGSPDMDALQSANATRFAAEHGLDGSVESLELVDDAIEERRRAHGLRPGDVDEELTDGDLVVLAGAYAGEVLRRHTREAVWWLGPAGNAGPLHLRAGLGLGTRVNTLGRVRGYLRHGSRESVHTLVSTLLSRLNG